MTFPPYRLTSFRWALLAALLLSRLSSPALASADPLLSTFLELGSAPHRLPGSPEHQAAARALVARLTQLGFSNVVTMEFPVWFQGAERCELRLESGGAPGPLLPLRGNLLVPPATPPGGIQGPYLYAGFGTLPEYGTRSPQGAVVGLEFDSGDAWRTAFALGAAAVIFLDPGEETVVSREPKHVPLPINFVRLFAPKSTVTALALRRDHPAAHLISDLHSEWRTGQNIAVHVPGTDPEFDAGLKGPESLVITADYDSWGLVPELAPDATAAGNAAALMQMAAHFRNHPPRRHLLLVWLDDRAPFYNGARHLYETLLASSDTLEQWSDEIRSERLFLDRILNGLPHSPADASHANLALHVGTRLDREADFLHSDQTQRLLRLRIERSRTTEPVQHAAIEREIATIEEDNRALDTLRRAIGERSLHTADPRQLSQLVAAARTRIGRRAAELRVDQERVAQRIALRALLPDPSAIALHIGLRFSDGTQRWSVALGDAVTRELVYRTGDADRDLPGYYGRIFGAVRHAAEALPADRAFESSSLDDPSETGRFVPAPLVTSSVVAGMNGIYNLAFVTLFDGRVDAGLPSDTIARFSLPHLQRQVHEATLLIERLATSPRLSVGRVFSRRSEDKRPRWNGVQSQGDYVGIRVSGGLSEDRPAEGAFFGLSPNADPVNNQDFTPLRYAADLPEFEPLLASPVNANGNPHLPGILSGTFNRSFALAFQTDAWGNVRAITGKPNAVAAPSGAMRVNLFPARGFGLIDPSPAVRVGASFHVLRARSDTAFEEAHRLIGQSRDLSFFYLPTHRPEEPIKVFQSTGPVYLGFDAAGARAGLAPQTFHAPPPVVASSARELWLLNEERLGLLRRRGVTDAHLESLHAQAGQARADALAAPDLAAQQAGHLRSLLLSRRVYDPVRNAMDDLVRAVVWLLLLAIPFAFALERLLFAATTIYRRIAGFAGSFAAVFFLLYLLHPGFAIATTPVMIVLAFTITLLSALVIGVILQKFDVELKALQGQTGGLHRSEVSGVATALAAANMGISTMRRRPVRTLLTAFTVTMLTFTILCFASVTGSFEVLSVAETGEPSEGGSPVLVRDLSYDRIDTSVLQLLEQLTASGGLAASRWWLVRRRLSDDPYSIATGDGTKALWVDAIMGLDPREVERWPELAAALGMSPTAAASHLQTNGIFLPAIVQRQLNLQPGDPLRLHGRLVTFAGAFDSERLERLRQIDGRSALPVNFMEEGRQVEAVVVDGRRPSPEFNYLAPDQIAIAPAALIRGSDGRLTSIGVFPPPSLSPPALAQHLAELISQPVWVRGATGVQRLIFLQSTDVQASAGLLLPLLLGGLIIFGTLLGSISDREREIYTFSALGLSARHVGLLFFAEAAVYAVLGGLGGQLLAQAVALLAATLAQWQVIPPVSLNYSSTNALFAIGVVMTTVLISAAYPAYRASRSANPGLQRLWRLPPPQGDRWDMTFPFTVSAYDATGVVSFLAEHFRNHNDAGLGQFAASDVLLGRDPDTGGYTLSARVALAPFDLGVTQIFKLGARPSEIEGVDEIQIHLVRLSGTPGDWQRCNRVFIADLRRQFLLWRTLSTALVEQYRLQTIETLGPAHGPPEPLTAATSTRTPAEVPHA